MLPRFMRFFLVDKRGDRVTADVTTRTTIELLADDVTIRDQIRVTQLKERVWQRRDILASNQLAVCRLSDPWWLESIKGVDRQARSDIANQAQQCLFDSRLSDL